MARRKTFHETAAGLWYIGDYDTQTKRYKSLAVPVLYVQVTASSPQQSTPTVATRKPPSQRPVVEPPEEMPAPDTLRLVVERQQETASGTTPAMQGPTARQLALAYAAGACRGCGRVSMCACGTPQAPSFDEVLKVQRQQGKIA